MTPPENGSGTALSICVKRCHYIDEVSGEKYKGIASNYLCDLKVGNKVLLAGTAAPLNYLMKTRLTF